MQKKIIRRTEPNSTSDFSFSIHPLLQRIYSIRGIQSPQELEHGLSSLLPYQSLRGIETAVAHLSDALSKQKRIIIIGDFDADGATSSALAVRALRSFGAHHVDFLVPNRFEFGYGLTPEIVHVAKMRNPDVIVTVDNGIANHAGVTTAKTLGIQVIVTDHHLPADTLPLADAIVNPNQPDDLFPSKHIAGVGVIFYVMLALRRHLVNTGWFLQQNIPEPNMSQWLDLVALGTVADVVQLDQNNRILVQQGLRRIRAGHCIPGITALLKVGSRNQARLVASDLGFVVGPRLNAAGRLDDMSLGIECLLCDDPQKAFEMAQTLDQLNHERRHIEQEMQEKAMHFLATYKPFHEELPNGFCLFDPDWHQGVIGIVASRIKDRFHRPVIAFALANDHELKGSARSIPGIHIRDALADLAIRYPHLMNKFGGHAMAAGLTIPRDSFEAFSEAFRDVLSIHHHAEYMQHAIFSDGELEPLLLTLETAEAIREGGPWGQGFPEPTFDGLFQLVDQRIVGGKHLKMTLMKNDRLIDAIAFNVNINEWPNYRRDTITMAYRLDVNEYKGKHKVQLIVEHLEV